MWSFSSSRRKWKWLRPGKERKPAPPAAATARTWREADASLFRIPRRGFRELLLHTPHLVLVVAVEKRLVEQVPYDLRPRRHRMDKISTHQPGLGLIPLPHR